MLGMMLGNPWIVCGATILLLILCWVIAHRKLHPLDEDSRKTKLELITFATKALFDKPTAIALVASGEANKVVPPIPEEVHQAMLPYIVEARVGLIEAHDDGDEKTQRRSAMRYHGLLNTMFNAGRLY